MGLRLPTEALGCPRNRGTLVEADTGQNAEIQLQRDTIHG